MSTAPLASPTPLTEFAGSDFSFENRQKADDVLLPALDQLRSAHTSYLEMPGDAEAWTRFLAARRLASVAIARLPRKFSQSPQLHEVHGMVREMAKSGVHDHLAAAEDLAQAEVFARKGWPGLLASMLLVPAWQWPSAPLVMEVPEWLRADYVRWLFAAPQNFSSSGQAKAFGVFTLRRLEELVRWMNRGPGGAEELKVLGAYASHSSLLPASFGPDNLRRQAELRGQLLLRVMGKRDDHYRAPLKPRAGRRLRIGIVHRHFESQPEVYATLPLFENLDPERFEVFLFTYVSDFGKLEDYCRQKATDMIVLPADFQAQLSRLRNAALDVVLFGANVTAECNVVTRLALHRVAPLQVVGNSSGITSGLPEIDLYVSGALAATEEISAHFSERLGLMPGATHTFNFDADREEAQVACTRVDFGLPAEAFVFVTTANYGKIIPEMQQAWARLLAAVPGSYLLVHPFHQSRPSGHTITHFNANFEDVLKSEGVDVSRLVVSCVDFPSRTDMKGLVGLGDVYLDTFPCSAVDALVDPLELGLPVVTWNGDPIRSRTGASLLRTLDLGDLIATSAEDYQAVTVKLATDRDYWANCHERIRSQMVPVPGFLDSRAASQGFGGLMESAFDELVAQGRTAFRANPLPVRPVEGAKLTLFFRRAGQCPRQY